MEKFVPALLALLLPFALTGCPDPFKKDKNKPAMPAVRTVKGDPYVFVKGTAMNRKNELPLDLFDASRPHTIDRTGFVEEAPQAPVQDIEAGNEAPTQQGEEAQAALNTHNESITTRDRDVIEVMDSLFKLTFRINAASGTVRLERLSHLRSDAVLEVGKTLEVLHTSFTPDRRSISLLLGNTTAGQRFVVDFNLVPPGPVKSGVFTTDNFFYLLGRGVKMIWPQDQKRALVLCSSPSQGVTEAFRDAVNVWKNQLKWRLDLEMQIAANCPPFSDLNTQTVRIIDDWIEINGEPGTLGLTTPKYDAPKGEILDADIFILREELAEAVRIYNPNFDVKSPHMVPALRDFYFNTFLHEFGHFLGLHHQFEKDIASIMSYDPKITTLQPYDIRAIQALYPIHETSSQ